MNLNNESTAFQNFLFQIRTLVYIIYIIGHLSQSYLGYQSPNVISLNKLDCI